MLFLATVKLISRKRTHRRHGDQRPYSGQTRRNPSDPCWCARKAGRRYGLYFYILRATCRQWLSSTLMSCSNKRLSVSHDIVRQAASDTSNNRRSCTKRKQGKHNERSTHLRNSNSVARDRSIHDFHNHGRSPSPFQISSTPPSDTIDVLCIGMLCSTYIIPQWNQQKERKPVTEKFPFPRPPTSPSRTCLSDFALERQSERLRSACPCRKSHWSSRTSARSLAGIA